MYYRLLILFSVVSTVLCATASGESLLVFPDSFRYQENDGAPSFYIKDTPTSTQVTLRLEASRQNVISVLKKRYKENFDILDLVNVNILPVHVDFMSEFFSKANPSFQEVTFEYDLNTIRIQIKYNKDLTVAQIREAVLFPISMATVDAQIVCAGISFDGCGQVVRRIPVMNQFAVKGNNALTLKQSNYTYLRTYAANLIQTSSQFLSDAFAQEVLIKYWNSGNCQAASTTWHQDACLIAKKYSSSGSISEAVLNLAKELYPPDTLADNANYFVFSGSKLNLKRLNLGLDFEKLRNELNSQVKIVSHGDLKVSVPLIKWGFFDSTRYFQIEKDSLFWENQRILLAPREHLRGQANIKLKTEYRTYSLPVEFTELIGFKYDPMGDAIELGETTVEHLTFLDKTGYGYNLAKVYSAEIQSAVNAIVNSPSGRAEVASRVLDTLRSLSSTGIEPIVK